ncbi:hypothetical protein BCR33DRAFT_740394 [Rhizoclosmatium globosum]|uniref:Uncharacterized protein n=1 Tax=Rhizoclosmatium globosum TaxID=329046 RepID=A0A1Y2BZA5_9FUNG|nr:hypothetical protein BCR33DRAFT_740394 [Rhizoclosmatium globosum]|eukprot:ORY40099.1 hypothetical protein BCR33DRAFT_740394 [Rhizoclosmatium globosum]
MKEPGTKSSVSILWIVQGFYFLEVCHTQSMKAIGYVIKSDSGGSRYNQDESRASVIDYLFDRETLTDGMEVPMTSIQFDPLAFLPKSSQNWIKDTMTVFEGDKSAPIKRLGDQESDILKQIESLKKTWKGDKSVFDGIFETQVLEKDAPTNADNQLKALSSQFQTWLASTNSPKSKKEPIPKPTYKKEKAKADIEEEDVDMANVLKALYKSATKGSVSSARLLRKLVSIDEELVANEGAKSEITKDSKQLTQKQSSSSSKSVWIEQEQLVPPPEILKSESIGKNLLRVSQVFLFNLMNQEPAPKSIFLSQTQEKDSFIAPEVAKLRDTFYKASSDGGDSIRKFMSTVFTGVEENQQKTDASNAEATQQPVNSIWIEQEPLAATEPPKTDQFLAPKEHLQNEEVKEKESTNTDKPMPEKNEATSKTKRSIWVDQEPVIPLLQNLKTHANSGDDIASGLLKKFFQALTVGQTADPSVRAADKVFGGYFVKASESTKSDTREPIEVFYDYLKSFKNEETVKTLLTSIADNIKADKKRPEMNEYDRKSIFVDTFSEAQSSSGGALGDFLTYLYRAASSVGSSSSNSIFTSQPKTQEVSKEAEKFENLMADISRFFVGKSNPSLEDQIAEGVKAIKNQLNPKSESIFVNQNKNPSSQESTIFTDGKKQILAEESPIFGNGNQVDSENHNEDRFSNWIESLKVQEFLKRMGTKNNQRAKAFNSQPTPKVQSQGKTIVGETINSILWRSFGSWPIDSDDFEKFKDVLGKLSSYFVHSEENPTFEERRQQPQQEVFETEPEPRCATDPFLNGGFENGKFTHWNVVREPGSEGGIQVSRTGQLSSGVLFKSNAPMAVFDNEGAGSYVLYRDFVPAEGDFLVFEWQVMNSAATYDIQNDIYSSRVAPNQQFSVELVDSRFDDWFDETGWNARLATIVSPKRRKIWMEMVGNVSALI